MVPADQVEPLRQGDSRVPATRRTSTWSTSRARRSSSSAPARCRRRLPEPARTFMTWVNTRDVASLGPALLPHVAALGGDPALSPARNPPPSAPVYLLHGADDNVIPAAESAMLAADLRARGGRVTQLSTPLITHAEVDRPPGAGEIWRLIRFWAGRCSPGLRRTLAPAARGSPVSARLAPCFARSPPASSCAAGDFTRRQVAELARAGCARR